LRNYLREGRLGFGAVLKRKLDGSFLENLLCNDADDPVFCIVLEPGVKGATLVLQREGLACASGYKHIITYISDDLSEVVVRVVLVRLGNITVYKREAFNGQLWSGAVRHDAN
jgi:hypothetical protein